MKHRETVTVPAKEEVRVAKVTCDLCGSTIAQYPGHVFDEVRIRIIREKGERYSDYGDAKETGYDVCGGCFETKLVPWMASQGAVPEVEDTSY
jgi:hypothetical protein